MNGHEHIAAGEDELAVAGTKPTYSEAAAQHVAKATAHFTAAVALFLAETDPAELQDEAALCDGSCGEREPHPLHTEPLGG